MTHAQQRALAIAVTVILGGIALLQAGDPADLGLTPVMVRWLGVIGAMLGMLSGFLPTVQGRSGDPQFLIDRVSELSESDQILVANELTDRATRTARAEEAALDDERRAEGRG